MCDMHGVSSPECCLRIGGVSLALLFAGIGIVASLEAQSTQPSAPAFDVVSIKFSGTALDHTKIQGGDHVMTWKPLEFKGGRLSGDVPASTLIEFACALLCSPYRQEGIGFGLDYYRIDAIAPAGTTLDQARSMLRNTLIERVGFRYHLIDRETSVFYLVRGNGGLKLAASSDPEPNGRFPGNAWRFQSKASTLAAFARFLASVTGRDVVDKTGIPGNFSFDVDWSTEAAHSQNLADDRVDLAMSGVKALGLKLDAGKELRKVLIVDRFNRIPTPN